MGNTPSGDTDNNGAGGAGSSSATNDSLNENFSTYMNRRQSEIGTDGLPRRKSRPQLRAKSFLEREQNENALYADDGGDDNNANANAATVGDNNDDVTMDDLYLKIQQLSDKCAALESQNILVSVQQLDWLAQVLAMTLSVSILYFVYWKGIVLRLTTTTMTMADGAASSSIVRYIKELVVQEPFDRVYNFIAMYPTMMDTFKEALPSEGARSIYHYLVLVGDLFKESFYWVLSHLPDKTWTWLLRLALLAIPYLYNRYTHGSMHRRFQVFGIAAIIVARIRMCRWRERNFLQDDPVGGKIARYGESCTNDGIWEANYEISARFLYLSIRRLRGLWTKTAQYLSSRADFVPVAYIRELSKLQDQALATEWKDIEPIIVKQQGKRGQQYDLTDIEETPMASASIGQVHVGRLVKKKASRSINGEDDDEEPIKVAIKIQHPFAKQLMTDDFTSLKLLTKVLAWLEPDYAFMEILMREWAVEARKELDFQIEADHMRQARAALKSMYDNANGTNGDSLLYTSNGVPFQVQVPEPIDEYCTDNLLVMKFCEGCRVDDFAQLEAWKLPREDIINAIAQTFAHFMYCTTIFNGDPHAGNILVHPGTSVDNSVGFTISILDWGLAKCLKDDKRLAFCQMVYAAATLDYGLLLDSYKLVGLKMKREDAGQSMEDMRFFLRDMAPRETARARIKRRIKNDAEKAKKTKEKVPMESKAYPGEFFFFIRVNELLHGLGSRFDVNMGYLDALSPYAERGLRQSSLYDLKVEPPAAPSDIENPDLQQKLVDLFQRFEQEGSLAGGQVCVLDKAGKTQANVVAGSLGGLYSHVPMPEHALILGYSATKAIASTLAHIMVEEGYLAYDEPICQRVWKAFCPTKYPSAVVGKAMGQPIDETVKRWEWKRQITLRHILNHTAGFGPVLPTKLSMVKLASCEQCFRSYEYSADVPEETLLPVHAPGESVQYHYMSFGWLVAGTLCGAYSLRRRKRDVTFAQVYASVLGSRLSPEIKAGFWPVGVPNETRDPPLLAQTVTSDVRASKIMQRLRDTTMGDNATPKDGAASDMFETFRGKEFLLDPRIWNNSIAQTANVPSAGGRFSARGLAQFYSKLGNGKLISFQGLEELFNTSSSSDNTTSQTSTSSSFQGMTRITSNDSMASRSKLCMGYQLVRTDRDAEDNFSCVGHAGIGGSIGFWHRPTGLAVGLMLNKADADIEVTTRILEVIADCFEI